MTRVMKSYSDPRKAYFVTIDEHTGQCVDCQCPDHQYRHHECKHQRDLNTEILRAEKFASLMRQYDVRGLVVKAARREAYVQEFGIYQ